MKVKVLGQDVGEGSLSGLVNNNALALLLPSNFVHSHASQQQRQLPQLKLFVLASGALGRAATATSRQVTAKRQPYPVAETTAEIGKFVLVHVLSPQ